MEDLMSVGSVANELGLSAVQVRRLAREQKLSAEFIGGQWVIPRSAVTRRLSVESPPGRPLSSETAWIILGIIDNLLGNHEEHVDLDRRRRYRLKLRLKSAPEVERWPQWFSRRADQHRVWVHPGRQERFVSDARVHAGGAFAASRAGNEIVALSPDRFYVKEGDWPLLVKEYRCQESSDGLFEVLVVPDSITGQRWPTGSEPISLGVSLLDMLESSESRDRSVAQMSLGWVREEMINDRAS
jgi:excisionase family DNA binding protein